jgi:hypothetical protein
MTCGKCGGTLQRGTCNLCEMFETGATPGGTGPSGWPMVSKAMGVHRDQVGEANAEMARHGCGVRYDPEGNAHVPDRGERKKALKIKGLHDNDGGFGD